MLLVGRHPQLSAFDHADAESFASSADLLADEGQGLFAADGVSQHFRVDYVILSAFPANEFVLTAVVVRGLDNELEFELAEPAHGLEVKLGDPEVAFGPRGANARLSLVLARVPVPNYLMATDEPYFFAELRLVSNSDAELAQPEFGSIHPARSAVAGLSDLLGWWR